MRWGTVEKEIQTWNGDIHGDVTCRCRALCLDGVFFTALGAQVSVCEGDGSIVSAPRCEFVLLERPSDKSLDAEYKGGLYPRLRGLTV